MTQSVAPLLVTLDRASNLNDVLAQRVADTPDKTLVERKTRPDGPWQPVTAREFDEQVVAVAKGLVARGVQPGDRVGIMARTRYEWSVLDWAVWGAGAVGVPIYETSSAEQVLWILSDSAVSFLVVEHDAHAATVAEVRDQVPAVRDVRAQSRSPSSCTIVWSRWRQAGGRWRRMTTFPFTRATTGAAPGRPPIAAGC